MISMEQIDGEIAILEDEKPTHIIMEKLANLYTVRDHMVIDSQPVVPVTTVIEKMPILGSGTEFGEVASTKRAEDVFRIIDELMDALMVLNPGLYNSVIRKISDL